MTWLINLLKEAFALLAKTYGSVEPHRCLSCGVILRTNDDYCNNCKELSS